MWSVYRCVRASRRLCRHCGRLWRHRRRLRSMRVSISVIKLTNQVKSFTSVVSTGIAVGPAVGNTLHANNN